MNITTSYFNLKHKYFKNNSILHYQVFLSKNFRNAFIIQIAFNKTNGEISIEHNMLNSEQYIGLIELYKTNFISNISFSKIKEKMEEE